MCVRVFRCVVYFFFFLMIRRPRGSTRPDPLFPYTDALPILLIRVSLVGLALALLADARPPLALSAAVIALFAIGHGFAHGSEIGAGASAYPFAGGFLIATALLHEIGRAHV